MWAGAALSQTGTACLFSPAELSSTLGQTPEAGVASKDRLGMLLCQYKIANAAVRGFSVRINPKCDQQRFEGNARLRQSTSGKANTLLNGYGDAAYYSPDGSASIRVGKQCIELSGLRGGKNGVITEAEAKHFLELTVSRAGAK
jgi:hypothetical protein